MGHSLSQEVAIVIGAGRGIGHAIALYPLRAKAPQSAFSPGRGGDRRDRRVDLRSRRSSACTAPLRKGAAAVRATPSCPVSGSGWGKRAGAAGTGTATPCHLFVPLHGELSWTSIAS